MGVATHFTNTATKLIEPYRSSARKQTIERHRPTGQFGFSFSPAGDWNQDTFSDLFICFRSAEGREQGNVLLYTGSTAGLTLAASTGLKPRKARTGFGYSIASGRDINGDGKPDVVVGAPEYHIAEGDVGHICAYYSTEANGTVFKAWLYHND